MARINGSARQNLSIRFTKTEKLLILMVFLQLCSFGFELYKFFHVNNL